MHKTKQKQKQKRMLGREGQEEYSRPQVGCLLYTSVTFVRWYISFYRRGNWVFETSLPWGVTVTTEVHTESTWVCVFARALLLSILRVGVVNMKALKTECQIALVKGCFVIQWILGDKICWWEIRKERLPPLEYPWWSFKSFSGKWKSPRKTERPYCNVSLLSLKLIILNTSSCTSATGPSRRYYFILSPNIMVPECLNIKPFIIK